MKNLATAVLTLIALGPFEGALAQKYPTKPVTVIVPYAAGGATDVIARLTSQGLLEELGQAFIVDNKGGGGGMIGVETAARAAADGYTLLFSSTGPATISPLLFASRGFDPLVRLEPIVQVASSPAVLLVRNGIPVKTIEDLIALSKSSPTKLNMASAGNGSLQHLIGEYLQSRIDTKWVHIPFRGTAPAFNELIAGRVDVMVDVIPAAAPLVRAGKVRAIAVMVPNRSDQLPDVPSLDELGVKGFDFRGWHALFAPKGVPSEVIATVNSAVNRFLQKAEAKAKLAAMGAGGDGGAPERLAARMKSELREWANVIKSVGISVAE